MATANSTVKSGKTKTAQVIEYLKANPETSVYAAAKKFDAAPASVYRRLKQLESVCPCCGQTIKESATQSK